MNDTRAKSLGKAIDLIEKLQDDITFAMVLEQHLDMEAVLQSLQKVRQLIDRSYPEDIHDDRFYQRELDFSTEDTLDEGGLDGDEEEETR